MYSSVVHVFVGLVLNSINFLVLRSKNLTQATYTFLLGLALADFMSLLMFGLNSLFRGHFLREPITTHFEVYAYIPVGSTSTTASILLIVVVTCERHVALTHPIIARTRCTPVNARMLVTLVWLASCVINLPRWFVFDVDASGALVRTQFGASRLYAVLAWAYFIVLTVGCSASLVVLNSLLIRGLRRASAKRRLLATRDRRTDDVRLTRMLVAVVVIFLAGELPSAIFSRFIVAAIARRRSAPVLQEDWYAVCACVATVCVVTQHSLNFLCYCAFNKRFREELARKFCGTTGALGVVSGTNGAREDYAKESHLHEHSIHDTAIPLQTLQ